MNRWERTWCLVGGLLVLMGVAGPLSAAPRLASVFGDHAVLQRDLPVPVWGWAEAGEQVTVSFAGQAKSATAAADGKWRVTLDALPASAEGRDLTVVSGADSALTVRDVLVGEVWLCSGQSNMRFPLEKALNGEAEVKTATVPGLRLFTAKAKVALDPAAEIDGRWDLCTPETAAKFSAVAFLFGREIGHRLQVPVGLVVSAQDWTPGEAWMSREALLAEPELRYIAERWDALTANHAAARRAYDSDVHAWQAAGGKDAAGAAMPKPKAPSDPMFLHRAAGLFNGGIAPLVPLAMRGVVWYQGETNDSRGYQYRALFNALIRDWRRAWGGRDFPFLFVQVANVLPPDPEPVDSEWAELRESQALALALPHTGMAVTIDIGEEQDVHPKNKQDVAHRLALVARATVYGEQDVPFAGPTFARMQVEAGSARVFFSNAGGGLVCKGDRLRTFAVAGEDREFVWADAAIDGDSVVVRSDKVSVPVAVRYAWANNPAGCNLYSAAGLPAVPFRTDRWPEKTRSATALFIDQ